MTIKEWCDGLRCKVPVGKTARWCRANDFSSVIPDNVPDHAILTTDYDAVGIERPDYEPTGYAWVYAKPNYAVAG